MKGKNKQVKLSVLIIIVIIAIILTASITAVICLNFGDFSDKYMNNEQVDSMMKQNIILNEVQEESIENENEDVVSVIYNYVDDLNGDGNKEKIKIEFERNSESVFYHKVDFVVIDGATSQKYNLTKEGEDFLCYCNPKAYIINIDDTDKFKEILICGIMGDSSPQDIANLLVEYKDNKLKEMFVNKYNEGAIKTFDYERGPNSNYMMEGVGGTRIFNASEGFVRFNSNSNKRIFYKLNEEHELVLDRYIFDNDEKYYTEFLNVWQRYLNIYENKDINSNFKEVKSKAPFEEKEFYKVIKVEEHWLTIESSTGEIGYAYIEDIIDVLK